MTQPPLTQTLGPWVAEAGLRPRSALSREMSVLSDLHAQLPDCDRFAQAFSPGRLNALPFRWAGHDLAVRYTYRLELGPDHLMWDGFSGKLRTEIRKAQKRLVVRSGLALDRFFDVWSRTFARQGLAPPHDLALLERLDASCAEHEAREVLYAEDEAGRIHAVNYFVWSHGIAHGLMSGADPALRASGGQKLVLWEVLRRASERAGIFDFSGSMMPTVEPLFREAGARQVPYLSVSRNTRRMALALAAAGTASHVRMAPGRALARRDEVQRASSRLLRRGA